MLFQIKEPKYKAIVCSKRSFVSLQMSFQCVMLQEVTLFNIKDTFRLLQSSHATVSVTLQLMFSVSLFFSM
jgi:hypothetical protein